MACTTLSGIGFDICTPSIGGIKIAYIAQYEDKATLLTGSAAAGWKVDLTKLATEEDAHGWYKYEFRKASGSLTSTYNIDDTVGSRYVSTDVALQFSILDDSRSKAIDELVKGQLIMVVETAAGKLIFLGFDNPVTATEATMQSGTAYSDLNGYTITLQDISNELPFEVENSKA